MDDGRDPFGSIRDEIYTLHADYTDCCKMKRNINQPNFSNKKLLYIFDFYHFEYNNLQLANSFNKTKIMYKRYYLDLHIVYFIDELNKPCRRSESDETRRDERIERQIYTRLL